MKKIDGLTLLPIVVGAIFAILAGCSNTPGSSVATSYGIGVYDGADHLELVSAIADKYTAARVYKYDQEPPSGKQCSDNGVKCYRFTDDFAEILQGKIAINHSTGADSYNHGNVRFDQLPAGITLKSDAELEAIVQAVGYPSDCPAPNRAESLLYDATLNKLLNTCGVIEISQGYKDSNSNWSTTTFDDAHITQYCHNNQGWVETTNDITENETSATGCMANGNAGGWDETKNLFRDEVARMINNPQVLEIISSHQAPGSENYRIHLSNVRAAILYDQYCQNSENCTAIPEHFLFVGAVSCENEILTTNFQAGEMAEYFVVAYDSEANSGLDCIADYASHNAHTHGSYGSSFSAPRATALAGELKRINPQLTATQIATIIKETATRIPVDLNNDNDTDDEGESGVNKVYGYGLINASAAQARARSY